MSGDMLSCAELKDSLSRRGSSISLRILRYFAGANHPFVFTFGGGIGIRARSFRNLTPHFPVEPCLNSGLPAA
jgi:hypothetical protein